MSPRSTLRSIAKERSPRAFLAIVLAVAVVLVSGWPGRASFRCLATGERDLEDCCCQSERSCPAGDACQELDRECGSQGCGCCVMTLEGEDIELAKSDGSPRTNTSHGEKLFACALPLVPGMVHPVRTDRALLSRWGSPRAGPLIFLRQRVMRC